MHPYRREVIYNPSVVHIDAEPLYIYGGQIVVVVVVVVVGVGSAFSAELPDLQG